MTPQEQIGFRTFSSNFFGLKGENVTLILDRVSNKEHYWKK